METNDTKKTINNFTKKLNSKNLLLFGKWGTGKTHLIQKVINEAEEANDANIIYLSLFGLKDISIINNKLFQMLEGNRCTIFLKKSLPIITKLLQPFIQNINLSSVTDVATKSLNTLNKIKLPKKMRGKIIVFDDLERMCGDPNDFVYIELFGYVSYLNKLGAKTICVCNTDLFQKSKIISLYKEKLFDHFIEMNVPHKDAIENILNNIEEDVSSCIEILGTNLRNFILTKDLFDDIKKVLDEKIHNQYILEYCAIAIDILNGDNKDIDVTKLDMVEKITYDEYCNVYGLNIGKRMFYYLHKRAINFENDINWRYSVQNIVNYKFGKITEEEFIKNIKNRSSIENIKVGEFYLNDFYLLSDEEKNEYYLNALNLLSQSDILIENNIEIYFVLLRLYYKRISQEYYDAFIKLLKNNMKLLFDVNGNKTKLMKNLDLFTYDLKSDGAIEEANKNDYIVQILHNTKIETTSNIVLNLYNSGDDKSLLEIIKIYKNNSNLEFYKKMYISNNYFMIDISGHISVDKWVFAHYIAKLAKQYNVENEFKVELYKMIGLHPDDQSLKDRVEALIKYKLK